MIRGLIFDFDGLIVETELPCYQAWLEIFQEYGQELPLVLWRKCIGTSYAAFDPHAYLEELLRRPLGRAELRARQEARYQELTMAQPILPGVGEIIRAAAENGLRLAVASSSPRNWVAGNLSRLGLLSCFATLKCKEDVNQVKPDPALYLASLADLGLEAREALAFEDSPNGLLAAKRAGLRCVAIPSELTRGLDFDQADLCLASLAGITLAELLAGMETDVV